VPAVKTILFSNEFPPYVYGGAGVHVDYLSRELAKLCDVEVRCFGDQDGVTGHGVRVKGFGLDQAGWTAPAALQSVFGALDRGLQFNTSDIDADLVHLHTWYTHFGGIAAKLNYGIPMVLTVHSLEPLRPWKREQLGGGYDFSLWIEKTAIEMADAVVAVSEGTKADILAHFDVDPDKVPVIYNGIDPSEYCKRENPDTLRRLGVDPERPYVLFVGRITRQKGIVHLANAIRHMDPSYQVVLCAGAPDTPEISAEMEAAVRANSRHRDGVIWIREMLDDTTKIALYSGADVFCCPSIYEPFGIINLEAMACETAVVCSAVGGMVEVVVDGETGFLVPLEQQSESPFEALDPEQFSRDLAARINQLMADPQLCAGMAAAGRQRAVEVFSWEAIGRRTFELYQSLLGS
jgi:glycogen synthase